MANNVEILSAAVVNDDVWDAFVARHPHPHILQTSGWAALKGCFGWRAERVALVDRAGELRAGAELLYRTIAGLTLAYVPRGPLVDWSNASQTRQVVAELEARARMRGAVVLKFEPELLDDETNRARMRELGFQPGAQTVQPPSTIVLDLAQDEDAILAEMKSKWRYNVRLAARKGVTVRALARDELDVFNALMTATGARDGFAVHGAPYFATAYELLARKHGVFLVAEHAGEPLAALAVFAVGHMSWYLWGASNDRERNRMPNHALQWAAMQWAKERGATRYDLWGIPDELGKLAVALSPANGAGAASDALPVDLNRLPGQDLWGVYRFKQGFGGRIVRTVGAWDKPLHAAGFRAYDLGLVLREQPARLRTLDPAGSALAAVSRPSAVKHRTLRTVEQPQEWQNTLADLPEPHVLQSWEWGEVKAGAGWTAERLVLPGAKGAAEAAAQFLWRQPVDQLPLRVAYVPKGPVVDWHDVGRVERMLAQIEAHAHARQCIYVKIDPDVAEDETVGRVLAHTLFRRGWRASSEQIQFKNTAYSDLTVGEEELLAGMKSKWRYNVRVAARRGLTVRMGTPADLPAFYALYAETGERDGFLIRPYSYYAATWQRFLAAENEEDNPAGGALLLAEHPEDALPVAGLFLLRYGATCWYFYGASSQRRRRDMPNYLLQWEALRWARARDCTRYDWWGAPTDLADPDDRMQGVWNFKQGFGANFQRHIGAWDYAVSPLLYRTYLQAMPSILEMMRRRS